MYIVSWTEKGAVWDSNKEKTFRNEREAEEFYNAMKAKQDGVIDGLISDLTFGLKNKIENVRIREV